MERLGAWLFVVLAVAVALLGNYLGATWASKDDKFSLLLLAVIAVSPFVFITFGLVTSRLGVAIGSGTIDALLTVCTIIMGLFLFQEWSKISVFQYFGLALVLSGIVFLQFS
ncbi:MAG: hypothetical protein G01um10148_834 [Parcubacteria group bacterium Gr01-1014_8]|nr:MAG: hypothetical protein G01um10148_834 [Parcubacteria group bacterium Gr01-1014_8]